MPEHIAVWGRAFPGLSPFRRRFDEFVAFKFILESKELISRSEAVNLKVKRDVKLTQLGYQVL